jgi:hypothetical protein
LVSEKSPTNDLVSRSHISFNSVILARLAFAVNVSYVDRYGQTSTA